MRNNQPTASLVFSGNTLKVIGQGPIAANFTKDMVKRLFKLRSSRGEYYTYENAGLTAAEIMPRLTKQAYDSFFKVINSDPQLMAEHAFKEKNFAAYAYPTTAKWPPCDGLMVLEAIPIDLPFLLNLIWMLDGTLWVDCLDGNTVFRSSAAEFAEGYGKSVREYCEERLPISIDACQRALSLVAAEPTRATVSYINKKSEVEKKTMFFWQPDQIEQYLRRYELSHIATDTE
jgi:hypothetical protein